MKAERSEGMKIKKPVYLGRFSTFSPQMTQGWGLGYEEGGVSPFCLQMMAGWGLGVWGRLAEGWGVGEGASHLFPSR